MNHTESRARQACLSASRSLLGSRQTGPRHSQPVTGPGRRGLSRIAGRPARPSGIATTTVSGRNSRASCLDQPASASGAPAQDEHRAGESALVERLSERRATPGVAAHQREKHSTVRCAAPRVALLAGQRCKPAERPRRHAVARGRRVVVARFGPVDQLSWSLRGEEEPARLAVLELLEQHVGQRARKVQVGVVELGLQQLEQRRSRNA